MARTQTESDAFGGPAATLPDKLYFKMGEAVALVGVQAHVLRYWENQIPGIRPKKSNTNQRRYRRQDVELFRELKRLLHEEKYTLAGAKKRLARPGTGRGTGAAKAGHNAALASKQKAGDVLSDMTPALQSAMAPALVAAAPPTPEPAPSQPVSQASQEQAVVMQRLREQLEALLNLACE